VDNLKRGANPCCRRCYEKSRPLTDAQRDAVTRLYPWASRIIRRWLNRWPRYQDEIRSAMHLGLCKGIRSYDPAKSDNEATFVVVAIFTQIRRDIRTLEAQRQRFPIARLNHENRPGKKTGQAEP
jgi:DNA-directed RNA polymerase specialized sigma subunit